MMNIATRERNERPWWFVSGSGILLAFTALGLHVVWPERLSDHLTMEITAVGVALAGAKTVKDAGGKLLRDRRASRNTAEQPVA